MIVNIGIPESEITKPVLDAGLEAVTRLNEQLLRAGKAPDFGAQIRMGHFWAPEPPGQESFDHAGTLAKRGNGDCDDWAPLHAATLRVTGVDPGAKAVVYRSGPNMWHAVTERSDGSFQDPSQTAGMKTRPGGRAAGIPAAVVGSMSVVGGDMDQPLIAIKDCSSGTCTMTWVARSDLPITNGPLARQGASIVVRKSAATPAKALAGSILGAAVLGAASRFTSKRHLDKLYALSGLLKGKSVRQVAGIVGEDAVKDAIKTLAEICPQILDELRAHRRAVEGGSRRVGNIFDGVYTDPYGAGTPPEGRASGDIWSGVYDGGVDPARYDWPAQPAPPVEDIRPAPPVERARPAPPRERPAPPRERPAPPRERPLPPREDAIEGIRRAVGRAVRGAPQGPDLSRLSPAQRAAHAQHRADMLAAIQTELEAKLVGNSLDDEDVDVAVRIGDIVGRGHHRKHKRKKHKQQQQQQSSDDGGGGDGGGGDDGGGGGGGGSPGAPGGGGGGGGGDDGGGDDGGGDDGGDSDVSGTDPGSRAAAAVRSWKRLQGASPNPGFHGRMTRDADGVAFDFAGHFNRVMGCIGEVEGPSSLVIAAASQRLLDPDLPQDTEDAVLIALKQDTDTAQLRSFGQSLLPHFPAAASVLFARAAKLDADSGNVYSGVSGFNFIRTFKTMAHDAVRVGPLAFVPGAGAAVILATGLVAAGHSKAGFVKDARRAFAKLNNNKVFHTITSTYGHLYNQANPAFFAGTLVAGAADDLLHGEKLGQALKEQGKKLSSYLTEKASYAAQAGGVPPSVVPMLKGAAALASGQKIPGGILGVAAQAIPGGAEALSQGAGAVSQMINEGASAVKDVANARAALPPAAQAVFDQGAVLALGKHLQDKGFHQAQDLIHSADGTLEKKVLNALDMVKPGAPGVSGDGVPEPPTTALARPAPPTSPARPSPPTVTPSTPAPPLFRIAHARLRQQLPADAAEQVKKALAEVVLHPELARLPSHELARRLRITEPVARVVYASISHEVPGAPIVHTHRVEALVGRPAPPVVLSSHPSRPWTKFYVPSAPAAPQSTELAKLEQERAEHEVRARAESERLRALHAHTVANAAIESERLRMAHEEHADRAHTEAVRIRDAHRRVA